MTQSTRLSALSALVFSVIMCAATAQTTFSTPNGRINFQADDGGSGPCGDPDGVFCQTDVYPSNIAVSGLSGSISNVTVTLNNLNVNLFGSVDILLVAPNGTQIVLYAEGCYGPIANTNFVFTDSGSSDLQSGGVACNTLANNSTHRPAAAGGFGFYWPVAGAPPNSAYPPATGVATFAMGPNAVFAGLTGAALNGTWSLYVEDEQENGVEGYLGDSTVPAWTITITTASASGTSTSVMSSLNPSFTGDTVTFTSMVTSGSTVNGGTVTFSDGGSPMSCSNAGGQTVTNGVATCVTASLIEGAHVITAAYGGNGTFGPSGSTSITQVVNNHTTAQTGAPPGTFGFCNAGSIAIPKTGANGDPSGTPASPYASEIFVSGLTGVINSVQIILNGVTSNDPESLGLLLAGPNNKTLDFFTYAGGSTAAGPLNLTIADSGATQVPSGSAPVSNTVYKPAAYVTALPDSYCQSTFCNGVTVSEALTAPVVSAAPAGMGTLLGQFAGANPNGTWQLFGVERIGGQNGSISNWCLNFTLSNGQTTTTSVTGSPNGSFTAAPDNSVTITATVTNQASPNSPISEGSVQFTDGTTNISCSNSGGQSVVNGAATCITTFLVEGSHPITATYSGSANFGVSLGSYSQRVDNHTVTSVNGSVYSYCNPGPVSIPAGGANHNAGPAGPYPENIFVSNLAGAIQKVTISLNGYSSNLPNDITSLLVGPTGSNNLDFFSRAGGVSPVSNLNLVFDDSAAAGLTTGSIASGAFKPTSEAASNSYGPPAPGGPYQYAAPAGGSTLASSFGNVNPNGTWSLYGESLINGAFATLSGSPAFCLNFTVTPPVLAITKVHSGNFTQGQTGATYSITVSNNGPGSTAGTVSVTDTLPAGLTATSIGGTNWSCTLGTLTCTRADSLAASSSYEPITVTVNVANNAASPQVNQATVSGGGAGNQSTSDSTVITAAADLTIAKSHSGNFRQGDSADSYSIVVTNSGPSPTVGTVAVADSLPSGLTATAINGTGWSCTLGTLTCTRTDALAAASAYPGITVTVSVAANAPPAVTNTATVSGGGEVNIGNDTATDPTTITQAADLTIAKSHSGNFTQGQTGAAYTLTVTNSGGGSTTGTVTVTDSLPSGLTATAVAGTGWTCTLATLTCTRADVLAASSSYPAITLTVSVASNAPVSVTNNATVSGGGELNTGNDAASDLTTITQVADLTIAKSHSGNFRQGDLGDTYSIVVSNAGPGSSSGTVSAVDSLPSGLTATSIAGVGWTCSLGTLTCTRGDALAASSSYPAIVLTVNVAANAPASVTNAAAVSGGGELNTGNDSASDPTTITQVADLTIAKSHSGSFTVGDSGRTYTIAVSNAGPGATTGTVSVTDSMPAGLTATAIAGTGWTCTLATLTCTRADVLAASAGYPAITLTVNVALNAPASVTNVATVSGGGELNTANDSASDPTTIIQTVAVVVQTSPAGLSFTVDGRPYTSAQTLQWIPGSAHAIATTSPQSGGSGIQYVWLNWSDGGTISHSVNGPAAPTTYTANFQKQYLLTTAVSPAGGGTVTGAGYYNSGSNATVTATPAAGYVFASFSGTTTPPAQNPGSVTMNGPTTVTANFVVPTATAVAAASGQYSDAVTLMATVGPTSAGSQMLGGTVAFTVNGNPAGTAPVNASGVATVSYTTGLAAGTYPITAQFMSSNPAFANSGGSNTLTVTKENATVTPSGSNPTTKKVNSAGGTAGPITLTAAIVETPDGSAGDIANAQPVTCTLVPAISASNITVTATVSGGGAGGTETATCTFNNVPVNQYQVNFTVGGNYYTGTASSSLTVYDPAAGSVTGSGTLTHSGHSATFAFSSRYNGNTLQASLSYTDNGTTIVGSTAGVMAVSGNTAIFTVGVIVNGVSGYTATVTGVDNAVLGSGHDQFGLKVVDPHGAVVANLTYAPVIISVGNVVIQH